MPLSISRKVGESFMVGDDITITVTRVEGGKARFDVIAPRSVEVYREEVYRRIQAERAADRGAKDYVAGRFQRRGSD